MKPAFDASGAVVAAERCLECGGPYAAAPCTLACPAAIDVPAFVGAIARGEAHRAAATIFAENLLGGTCARVCPVETLCEGACVLVQAGFRPVEIGRLQRYATDLALGAAWRSRAAAPRNGRRVAVIGAGPAGLVCAGELAARGYAVTVYDAREEPGGLVRYAIAPYRQLREPLPEEVRQLIELGAELRLGFAVDRPERLRDIERGADAVFLGIGMGPDADVRIPGDTLAGVWRALPFIEGIKTGCPPRVGRRAVVIGGGNTSVDVAREALRLGAVEVTLVSWLPEADIPAYRHELAEADAEGVRFQWLTTALRFLGTDRLERVECQYTRPGPPDAAGRWLPEPLPGTTFVIPADTVIIAVGQEPRAEFLGWIDGLERERGRIRVDPATGRTANPKYFAGGDALNGGATVVEAVRTAKIAARGIDGALRGNQA